MARGCCVVGCKNNYKNSSCKFYSFPKLQYQKEQKKKWIAAVRRNNANGSKWEPKAHDSVCSVHFVGGAKSFDQLSPSYVPTIFPHDKKKVLNETSALNRHKRFMARREQQLSASQETSLTKVDNVHTQTSKVKFKKVNIASIKIEENWQMDEATQVNIYFESKDVGKTFICNRYISNNSCNAETQTDIHISTGVCKCKLIK